MIALVGAFNQEKALVGAFSVIVQLVVEPMEHYTALIITIMLLGPGSLTLGSFYTLHFLHVLHWTGDWWCGNGGVKSRFVGCCLLRAAAW